MFYVGPSVVTAAPASSFFNHNEEKSPSTCTSPRGSKHEKKTGTDHQLQQSRITSHSDKTWAHITGNMTMLGGGVGRGGEGRRRPATSQVASTRVSGNITSIGKIKCAKTKAKSWKHIFTLSRLKICLKQQFDQKWKFSRHPLKSEALQRNKHCSWRRPKQEDAILSSASPFASAQAKRGESSRQVARQQEYCFVIWG